tara:strand:- start:52 stop:630 length:579 start_codon:yes stop_codon:yes gene_type:complete
MSTLKTGALRGTSGTADSVQLHASNQSVTFPGAVTVTGALTTSGVIKQAEITTSDARTTVNGTSYTSVISRTITPSSTSAKHLILADVPFLGDSKNASVDTLKCRFSLTWNHSGISETDLQHKSYAMMFPEDSGMDMMMSGSATFCYVFTPGTTNEITYQVLASTHVATSGVECTPDGTGEDDKSLIVLEIL